MDSRQEEKSIPLASHFSKDDDIVFISEGLFVGGSEYYVAYSSKGEFYLVSAGH